MVLFMRQSKEQPLCPIISLHLPLLKKSSAPTLPRISFAARFMKSMRWFVPITTTPSAMLFNMASLLSSRYLWTDWGSDESLRALSAIPDSLTEIISPGTALFNASFPQAPPEGNSGSPPGSPVALAGAWGGLGGFVGGFFGG